MLLKAQELTVHNGELCMQMNAGYDRRGRTILIQKNEFESS